ncbi:hypothetical protein E2562_037853 [Oryza meyeriana var. granulata]|uniref:Uncharacterized protein n=1 Tax=Oryza meyeriana var. granulata TaxID=110450 RepID=A0A6G1E8D0_9ORYZ|nr:hypothetical protein E2562_037853 [Oryza meyeriana var. granulata]
MPSNLAMFPSADPSGYEPDTGCLKQFNEIAVYHNKLLHDALKNIRENHPDVRVVYADFFTPIIQIVESPSTFGFTNDILRCCCGGGGKYNFNISAGCGMPGVTRLIKQDGAKAVVVPGIPPLGCIPPNLAMFPSADPAGYESGTGCLKQFNEIAVYHNTLLQNSLKKVQKNHADVRVIYADFFSPVIRIVESPVTFG